MTSQAIAPPEVHEPPAALRRVLILGLVGVGCTLAAALVGWSLARPRRGSTRTGRTASG